MARALFRPYRSPLAAEINFQLDVGNDSVQRRLKIVRTSGSNLGGNRFDLISDGPKTKSSASPLAITTSLLATNNKNSTNKD